MYKINLQQIEYFLAVAEKLNFTEAARSLYISQPSLSKQISLLEEELGFQLFIRNKRMVRLTPAGEVLNRRWRKWITELEISVEEAVKANASYEGEIKVGMINTMAVQKYIEPVFARFSEKYPQTMLSFESYSFKELREKLLNGELDIIFTFYFDFDFQLNDDIDWKCVEEMRLCLVVPRSNPLAQRDDLTLADVKNEPFILISPTDSPSGVNRIVDLCRTYGFQPNVKKYVPNISSLAFSIANGNGIAIHSDKDLFENDDRLRFYPIPDRTHDSDLIAVWRRKNSSPGLRAIIQEIDYN
ncbi:DNA-binding transcriptional LysR family regulator [Catenibacillus scindens]|uniref:DNA-binding transcriptional LysR family regulator n=1 Tax=Catenibacillus scindens TaxID=673271 RepID=A0A7W8HCK7_9FIRM|nr:LysR family transcriptional regulator [Catenibacillus scindens]MBB5265922.1 DNA-binding transcriptional LysR family regulator [Catenibacillus scindens]